MNKENKLKTGDIAPDFCLPDEQDGEGKIAHAWPNVKVKGHAEAVKEKLIGLK